MSSCAHSRRTRKQHRAPYSLRALFGLCPTLQDEYGDRPSPFRRYNWARPDDDDDTEDVYGDRDSEQEGPGTQA